MGEIREKRNEEEERRRRGGWSHKKGRSKAGA